ncbi:MAG: hypothetical protein WBX15_09325, partial [Thermoanaerobaculia bacterium]
MTAVATLPAVHIALDGSAVPAGWANALTSILVRQRLSLATACEITFSEVLGERGPAPSIGAALEVTIGDRPPLFSGEVTALEHSWTRAEGRKVRLRAYDVLHRLRKTQRVAAQVRFTAGSLARELVAPLGLDVRGPDGPSFTRLIQNRQTDLDFLTDVCERSALYFFVERDTLRLFPLQAGDDVRPLTLGENLREVRLELNAETVCDSVTVIGWDPCLVEVHDARVERARTVPQELATVAATERTLTDELLSDEAQASALANGDLARRAAGEVGLWATCVGDPELTPGAAVEVEGVTDGDGHRAVVTT